MKTLPAVSSNYGFADFASRTISYDLFKSTNFISIKKMLVLSRNDASPLMIFARSNIPDLMNRGSATELLRLSKPMYTSAKEVRAMGFA